MYYDLTKKEFNKYEKEFKKTHIGSRYYISYVISYVFALLFFAGMNVWMILENSASIDISLITIVLVIISFLIGGTVIWIQYMKELKGYINSKLKKQ